MNARMILSTEFQTVGTETRKTLRAKRKLHSRNSEKISRGGMQAWADLRGPKGPYPFPPKLPPNNFQDKLSGVSGMQENLIAAGSLPRTQPRELTAFPQTL